MLARKYRPSSFDDMIGQDAMVRTLRNAFASGRIAHAWMLTGVRGVGKTTTARILARGLNYAPPGSDGRSGQPTVDMPEEGVHCRAILEGRHPDVVEIDAASHTGIDDIRDIIDSARYSPVSGRFKVYIVDEVHMLSRPAFNGLLKTLEEPPAHVKFVFATTEIRRVPVTVLSRCQRFDLRRVDRSVLAAHLAGIVTKEGVEADAASLDMLARAAEGSVRDSLSLLDQAIALSDGAIREATVRDMLGLAERGRALALFRQVMEGDADGALRAAAGLLDAGSEPVPVLVALAECAHLATRAKFVPDLPSRDLSSDDQATVRDLAATLSLRDLSRVWQVLLKGIEEAGRAPDARLALDMVIVRAACLADLPTPEEAIAALAGERGAEPRAVRAPASRPVAAQPADAAPASPAPVFAVDLPESVEDLIRLAESHRDRTFAKRLAAELVGFARDGSTVRIALADDASDLVRVLAANLREWIGRPVAVERMAADRGARTVGATRASAVERRMESVRADPLVREIFRSFPDAEIVAVRDDD